MKSVLKNNQYLKIGVILLVFVILVFAILNVIKIQQPAQICNNEQVPYTENSCHNVQVPYSDTNCQNADYTYNIVTNKCEIYTNSNPVGEVKCTLDNLERKYGDFKISYGFMVGNSKYTKSATFNVSALGSVSVTDSHSYRIDSCICEVTPPQLQKCPAPQYKTEQQCQYVTVYKTEQKCQDTVKYKTVSVWQSLMG